MLTETWLRDHLDAEVSIKNFSIRRVDRSRTKKKRGRNSGGVAVYLRDTLDSSTETLMEFSSGVVEALCLKIPTLDLIIAVVYRQPNDVAGGNKSTSEQFAPLLEELSAVIDSQPAPTSNILVAGDFNLPHTTWPDCTPKSGASADEKRMIEQLSNFCSQHFLVQVIDQPTHTGGNTLDLALTNNPHMFTAVSIFPTSPVSSHHMAIIETSLSTRQNPYDEPEVQSGFDRVNLHSPKTDWPLIKAELASTDWAQLFNGKTAGEMLEAMTGVCENVVIVNAPPKNKRRQNHYSLIPRERKILMRKRSRLRKQYSAASSDSRKSAIQCKLVDLERKLQDSHKRQAQNEEDRAVDAIKTNPKYFYSYAKKA